MFDAGREFYFGQSLAQTEASAFYFFNTFRDDHILQADAVPEQLFGKTFDPGRESDLFQGYGGTESAEAYLSDRVGHVKLLQSFVESKGV